MSDSRAVGGISARRKVIDFQGYDIAAAQLAIDGDVEQRQIAHSAFDLELGSIDQTCFGRSGGFAPTIFPLFQGTCFETARMVLGLSVMLTSSASEAGYFQPGALPIPRPLLDDRRRTCVRFEL